MSQYHQGPHFPVSSSPIRPLDVHVSRPTGSRHSPPFLDPRPWLQPGSNGRREDPVLSGGHRPLDPSPLVSARPGPPNWGKEAPPVESDAFKANAQDPHLHSSTGASAPRIPSHRHPNVPVGWQAAPAQLNLVAYKPFPENLAENGTSFFYRSPTPSARQRINQACERCRERKTKCSGGRPACIRCQARGLICEYASESRVRGSSKSRKRNSPFFRTPATSSATRRNVTHHDYAPRMSVDHSVWKSQPATSKASEGAQKIRRTTSGHSTESDESGGADSDVKGYFNLDGTQGAGLSSRVLPGIDALHFPFYRSQTAYHNAISTRNKGSPVLRISTSMPHLKHVITRYDGEEDLERSSSSIYSTASLDTSYAEPLSSSEDSIHSRCPSSSSSLGSNSHSSLEEEMLAEGISSTTIKLDSWPADSPHESGHDHSLDESEDPVDHSKENIHTGDVDGDTPRPSSQFNPSEWIHGGDYNHSDSDYRFPRPATPKAE